MKLASLGSGSGGNATLLDTGDGLILIDCGFSLSQTERRLAALGRSAADIVALLVTHEHSDHIAGVARLAAKYQLPVYLTRGTAYKLGEVEALGCQIVRDDEPFHLQGVDITPVAVPHDAREPVQFVFERDGLKAGVVTDLGSLTPRVIQAYRDCHLLLVEANHDLDMLARGPYPKSVQRRVAGRWGHLNNTQTAAFIEAVNSNASLRCLVLGHISGQNNHQDLVAAAVADVTQDLDQLHFASQDAALDWISCDFEQEHS